MPTIYLELMRRFRAAVLATKGPRSPLLQREAIVKWSEDLATNPENSGPDSLTPAASSVVRQIALAAYRTTDAQFKELLGEMSEDEAFELVIASALGAGNARMKAGLAALGSSEDAP